MSFIQNLFGGKGKGGHKELDEILKSLESNASNNYKDEALADLKRFEEAFEKLKTEGKITEKQVSYYSEKLAALKEDLKKYGHKDQKVRW